MKILYVASFTPGSFENAEMRMKALEDLGHDVLALNTSPYLTWGGRWLGFVFRRWMMGHPFQVIQERILQDVRHFQPEILWVDKGRWICADTLQKAKSEAGLRCIHYTPDPALIFHQSRHFVQALPYYDIVVTTKSYEVDLYRSYGCRDVLLKRSTYERRVHMVPDRESVERPEFLVDSVFIGNYGLHRELFLEPLVEASIGLSIWGWGWDRYPSSTLRSSIRYQGIIGPRYACALNGARLGLGLLSPLVPDQSTTRTIEIPACGGFLLAQRTPEHLSLFEEGKEAEFFSSAKELVDKARYYLAHPQERDRIAAAGHLRCVNSPYDNDSCVREIIEHYQRTFLCSK